MSDSPDWFREARFGMFIHWGLYSLLELGEWAFHAHAIPAADYEALTGQFRPAKDAAAQWAALAKRAGMRYAVLTTKHHDGYCLFDSKLTDYNSVRRGPGRDVVGEFVEAFRREGLRVGLYYSLGDWHLPAYRAVAEGDAAAVPALRQFLHGQIRELLTHYGRIDVLWYDGAWYDGRYLTADTLGAAEMNALARRLQPGLLINERAGVPGDFQTCENECKPSPPGVDWEMCTCINDLWGCCRHDYNYKTVNQLLFLLVNCAVQGGNLLLNIGPRADGSVPTEQVERLEAVGRWLERCGVSVYGTERLPRAFTSSGRITRKGNRLYLHTFYWPGKTWRVAMAVPWLNGRPVRQACILNTGQPVAHRREGDHLLLTGLPADPPDPADTVIVLELG